MDYFIRCHFYAHRVCVCVVAADKMCQLTVVCNIYYQTAKYNVYNYLYIASDDVDSTR